MGKLKKQAERAAAIPPEKILLRMVQEMEFKSVRISYSFYKKYFNECKTEAGSYREKDRTIIVHVPESAETIPETWQKFEQGFYTPGGCVVRVYGNGVARSFVVECNTWSVSKYKSKQIKPGTNSIKNLLAAVQEFEKIAVNAPSI